jgi:hypothetical protein
MSVSLIRACKDGIRADLAYFIIEAATMSLSKSGNSTRARAFCERMPAAIRVSYEWLFTLHAAACVSVM